MLSGSSKVVMRSLLKGHGHLGKERVRFQFDISIEKIHGLHSGLHTIKWTRGGRVAYTKPFQIEKKSKESLVIDQKLSLLCTLYCSKSNTNNSKSYDPKDSKLSLVSLKDEKKNEKTVGKIHFNIAQYAGVPNAEAFVTFNLNRKVSIDVTIGCTFVQLSKTSSGSVESNLSGLSVSSGEPEDDLGEEDSGDDLSNLLSPITPSSKNVSEGTKEVFGSGNKIAVSTTEESAKMKVSLSDLSSANTEGNCTAGLKGSVDQSARPGNGDDLQEDVSFDGKARVDFLEVENISLRREITETRTELEKYRQHCSVNENVITELRQALLQDELDMKAASNMHNESLRVKMTEMDEKIASIEEKAAQSARESAEQIRALHHQVDTMERAKQRAEEDLESTRREVQRLTTDQESVPDILTETQQQLRRAEMDKESAESKLLLEITKSQELEGKYRDLESDMSQLRGKLREHNEYSAEMKSTYNKLSIMYEKLREQNMQMQQELEECRNRLCSGGLKEGENLSGTVSDQVNIGDLGGNISEVEEIKASLQDANRRIAQLETEKSESQRKLVASSTDLSQLKQQLVASQVEHSKLLREVEELKVSYLHSQEMLEVSSQKSLSLQTRLAQLEQLSGEPGLMKSVGDLAALSERPPLQQRIVKILTAASEAKKTNKRLREVLQRAHDRERLSEIEVFDLKAVINRVTQEIQTYSERESKWKEVMKSELDEARNRAERAENSATEIAERKISHRREISELQHIIETLEAEAEATRESNNKVLAVYKQDLMIKREELETSAVRITSLERELLTKQNIEMSLSTRVRELEIEGEVIKKQAYHEIEISKAAAREAEMCNNRKSTEIEHYLEEIENLRVVSDNLKMTIQLEVDKAKEEVRAAQEEAKDNRKLREEAEGIEKELEQKVRTQKTIIESLRRNLQEAVSTKRRLSKDAGEESKKATQALEEKLVLESRLKQTETILRDREGDIQDLRDRMASLEKELEYSKEKIERCIERATTKLNQKEEEIANTRQREEELRRQLEKEQAFSFAVHEELNLTLKSCAKLSAQRADAVDEVESLTSQLNEANQENARANAILMNRLKEATHESARAKASAKALSEKNEELNNDLSVAGKEFSELQEKVASLRTQLYELQNKLTACKAGSEADISRTTAELEEVKVREESYRQEVVRKEELIEDLTAKLATMVGKNAADSAIARAELSEALSREKSHKEEIQRHKEMVEKKEEELMYVRGANALTTAELESDLAEALSREETYRMELKRLKRLVKDLKTKLENEKNIVASLQTEKEKPCERCANALASMPREADEKTSVELRANKPMMDAPSFRGSLSSSNIRKLDILEKITDAKLLEMLVETKMLLALAEEEKLQLEHLIRCIGDGDKHVQDKLARQASELELEFIKIKPRIDSGHDDCSRGFHAIKGGRMDKNVAERGSMLKRDYLPFFHRSSKGRKSTSTNASERKQKKEKRKSSRRKAQIDRWNIGYDSDDGTTCQGKSGSGNNCLSSRSSGLE